MGALGELLQGQPATILALSLTGLLLYNLSRKRAQGGPPVVSYIVPWVGSALTMGKDPDGFFRNARAKYGSVFKVMSIGQTMTFITDPALISAIYKDAKSFEFTPIRLDISEKVFTLSHDVLHDGFMTGEYFDMHHRALSPKSIQPLLASYTTHAIACIRDALAALPSSGGTPLAPLVVPAAFHAAALAFFGRALPSAAIYADFRAFDGAFHLILAGLPRAFMRAPARRVARVLDAFEAYLARPHDDACDLVRDTEDAYRARDVRARDLAAILASDLWALEANAIWAVYWTLALGLQARTGLDPLLAELAEARAAWDAAHADRPLPADLLAPAPATADTVTAFIKEAELPLLTSAIHETLRYTTSSFSVRRVTRPTVFAGYTFNEDERVVCQTRAIHQDAGVYDRAEEYVMDRYVGEGKDKMGRSQFLPFGGGVSMYTSALGEIKTYLTLLMLSATFEIDEKSAQRPVLMMERIGVGSMPPKGDINVLVHPRTKA